VSNDTLAELLGVVPNAVLVVHEPMEELCIPELYKRCFNVIRIDKQTLLWYRFAYIINQRLCTLCNDRVVVARSVPESDVVVTIQEDIWLVVREKVHPHLHVQSKVRVLIVGTLGSRPE
jgi:hypothetical protein